MPSIYMHTRSSSTPSSFDPSAAKFTPRSIPRAMFTAILIIIIICISFVGVKRALRWYSTRFQRVVDETSTGDESFVVGTPADIENSCVPHGPACEKECFCRRMKEPVYYVSSYNSSTLLGSTHSSRASFTDTKFYTSSSNHKSSSWSENLPLYTSPKSSSTSLELSHPPEPSKLSGLGFPALARIKSNSSIPPMYSSNERQNNWHYRNLDLPAPPSQHYDAKLFPDTTITANQFSDGRRSTWRYRDLDLPASSSEVRESTNNLEHQRGSQHFHSYDSSTLSSGAPTSESLSNTLLPPKPRSIPPNILPILQLLPNELYQTSELEISRFSISSSESSQSSNSDKLSIEERQYSGNSPHPHHYFRSMDNLESKVTATSTLKSLNAEQTSNSHHGKRGGLGLLHCRNSIDLYHSKHSGQLPQHLRKYRSSSVINRRYF